MIFVQPLFDNFWNNLSLIFTWIFIFSLLLSLSIVFVQSQEEKSSCHQSCLILVVQISLIKKIISTITSPSHPWEQWWCWAKTSTPRGQPLLIFGVIFKDIFIKLIYGSIIWKSNILGVLNPYHWYVLVVLHILPLFP